MPLPTVFPTTDSATWTLPPPLSVPSEQLTSPAPLSHEPAVVATESSVRLVGTLNVATVLAASSEPRLVTSKTRSIRPPIRNSGRSSASPMATSVLGKGLMQEAAAIRGRMVSMLQLENSLLPFTVADIR